MNPMPPIPDQPPGIDPEAWPVQLPDVATAAERVASFIRSFGDGIVYTTLENVPLYARDLEALVQFANAHQREPGQLPVVVTVTAVPLAHDYRFKIDFMDGGSVSLPSGATLTANEVAKEVADRYATKDQSIVNVELPEENAS
jgi:hypothetical protein